MEGKIRKQLSPEKRRTSHRSRRSWRRSLYDCDDSDDRVHGNKRSSRTITEEEIAEYIAGKAQRKAMRVARKLKSEYSVSGYSNDSNPFGDSNLNEIFVWRKKIDRDVVDRGVPLDNYSIKAERKRQRESMAEIVKLKKRKEERAIEKSHREEVMAKLAKERAHAEFQDWVKKEEEFHFHQSKIKSEIRLREGRAKPIDILTKHLNGSDDLDIQIEPYMIFKGLTVKEIEDLRDDIKLNLEFGTKTPIHVQYWESLLVLCDWELAESLGGVHYSVEIETEVNNLLQGKTCSELEALRMNIESQMLSGTAKVVEFWEAVLKSLHIYKAKASLKEIHAKILHNNLHYLEQPLESKLGEPWSNFFEDNLPDVGLMTLSLPSKASIPIAAHCDTSLDHGQSFHRSEGEDEGGSFSPELLHGHESEEAIAIDPEEDRAILEQKRSSVLQELASKPSSCEDNFKMKAMKAMGAMEEGDSVFGSDAEVVNIFSQTTYWWHDKYRPRKPKYLNRVHSGYVWNKYNQTHYGYDNPPPKIVQGYKFNIFYPDLVSKTKAPTYTIENDDGSNNDETCIIRFHAGSPYEDIAFRIVNKEWEYSRKNGFKCTFDHGILYLYFNFKRYRYRR